MNPPQKPSNNPFDIGEEDLSTSLMIDLGLLGDADWQEEVGEIIDSAQIPDNADENKGQL
jgi:hypothetical protein